MGKHLAAEAGFTDREAAQTQLSRARGEVMSDDERDLVAVRLQQTSDPEEREHIA